SASAVEISGRTAPRFTAIPTLTLASVFALLTTTLPDSSTSGYGGCTIGTSKLSPRATCSFVPSPDPNVAFTLYPVLRSNPGISCSTAARIPPGAINVISLVCAPAKETKTAATGTIAEMNFFTLALRSEWHDYIEFAGAKIKAKIEANGASLRPPAQTPRPHRRIPVPPPRLAPRCTSHQTLNGSPHRAHQHRRSLHPWPAALPTLHQT